LRFLQGWEAMLRVLFDLCGLRDRSDLVPTFPTPALRKVREELGTTSVGDTDEIKSLGHRLIPP
jgi:hypothetical protein